MMTQLNRMATSITQTVKVHQLTELINRYEVDMTGAREIGIN